jgi:hypothetical protein
MINFGRKLNFRMLERVILRQLDVKCKEPSFINRTFLAGYPSLEVELVLAKGDELNAFSRLVFGIFKFFIYPLESHLLQQLLTAQRMIISIKRLREQCDGTDVVTIAAIQLF